MALKGLLEALWWTLKIGAFTAAALVCLALGLQAFCGCAAEQRRIESMDNGATVIDGHELRPALPVVVDCSCSTIPCAELVESADWWNIEMYRHGYHRPVVLVQSPSPRVDRGCFIQGWLPPGERSREVGLVAAGRLKGRWTAILQRGEWDQAVIRHAIGHALGLDEDPPAMGDCSDREHDDMAYCQPMALDLRSIMQSDAPRWGRVTANDASLVMSHDEAFGGLRVWR